jgi:hypothetical protein
VTLRLQFRPLLVSGMLAAAEDGAMVILVDDEQPRREQAAAIWHELVHLLMVAAGVPAWLHDERRIDDMAKRLATAAPDIMGQKVDDIAGSILKLSREFSTVAKFNDAVREAYTANGWHSGRGRPTKDAKRADKTPKCRRRSKPTCGKCAAPWPPACASTPTPRSTNCAGPWPAPDAGNAQAPPGRAEGPGAGRRAPGQPGEFTGHLVHDLAVVMHRLPKGKREHLEAGLTRLLKQYAPAKAIAALEQVQQAAAANDEGVKKAA